MTKIIIISGSRLDLSEDEKSLIRDTIRPSISLVNRYQDAVLSKQVNTIVFHGDHKNNKGVDRFASSCFEAIGAVVQPCPAPWRFAPYLKHLVNGRMRNEWIVANALIAKRYHPSASIKLYCFPRESSTGSLHMLELCKIHPEISYHCAYLDNSQPPSIYEAKYQLEIPCL